MPRFILEPLKKNEEPLLLKLEETTIGGDMDLVCVDKNGDDWSLLRLKTTGELILFADIPEHFGFQLDSKGHLKVIKEVPS